MNKFYCFIILVFVSSSSVYSQSRHYKPISEWENQFYQIIDKNVWPNDVIENIDNYKNTLVGWVGIIEKFMTDESNIEYNIIGFYVKHHYFDWIEDFGIENKPIRLSSDGEGYFVCYYYAKKEADINELIKDIVGDCIINYGRPSEIDDGVIILTTEYLRIIPKIYVNQNWIKYGRGGFGEILKE
jgi:hypothetical protein